MFATTADRHQRARSQPAGELVEKVSNDTQILIVTPSHELAAEIEARCDAKSMDRSYKGETCQAGKRHSSGFGHSMGIAEETGPWDGFTPAKNK